MRTGEIVALEVKSGGAVKTWSQVRFDRIMARPAGPSRIVFGGSATRRQLRSALDVKRLPARFTLEDFLNIVAPGQNGVITSVLTP